MKHAKRTVVISMHRFHTYIRANPSIICKVACCNVKRNLKTGTVEHSAEIGNGIQ
jgi:hypothetical protein